VTAQPPVVGFVGLGAMGSRMAARLLDAGHPLVVYNRTPGRAADLERSGAQVAATPAEVAERADIVCGCLLNGAAIEQVYAGEQGLIATSKPGQVFVEHATFAPELARDLAARLRDRGADFLDAPVTGGPEAASSGQLTAMVGGTRAAVAEVSNILSAYAARVVHVGASGAGLELKLVNQLLVSCHVVAAAEAAAMIGRLNLPIETAIEVLNAGWAASAMLNRGLTRIRDQDLDASGATIGGLLEPQQLVKELAAEAQVTLTLMPVVSQIFQTAVAEGMGSMDLAAMVRLVEANSTEVTPEGRSLSAG
jgi:3-hydroxyisobutyrate dehydrogenase-like beta-hydroxyacid dehydrogenase